jgi:hypothetical protein
MSPAEKAMGIAERYDQHTPMNDSQARAIAYGKHKEESPEVQCQLYFILMGIE